MNSQRDECTPGAHPGLASPGARPRPPSPGARPVPVPKKNFPKAKHAILTHTHSEHASSTSFSGAAEGNGEARWGAENCATCPQGQCAKKLACWARKPQPLGSPCLLDRRCPPLYQERPASSCTTPEPGHVVSSEQQRKHTDVPQATALGQARAAPQHDAERARDSALVLFPGFT